MESRKTSAFEGSEENQEKAVTEAKKGEFQESSRQCQELTAYE